MHESKTGRPLPLRLEVGDRLYVIQGHDLRGYMTVGSVGEYRPGVAHVACYGWTDCALSAQVRRMRRRWSYRWWDRRAEITASPHLHLHA